MVIFTAEVGGEILKVKLRDSCFPHQNALGLAGENIDKHPAYFSWDRSEGDADVMVFTDNWIKTAPEANAKKKIALMIEPVDVTPVHYGELLDNPDWIDIVLTNDRDLADRSLIDGGNMFWYPFGGSWLADWGVHQKTEILSMIVGEKTQTYGHKLRHMIAEKVEGPHLYGKPYTSYLESKSPMLKPYMYSIVVENSQAWFTEKLIDCLSQGTVPIYWGMDLRWSFNMQGILQFQSISELVEILKTISIDDYVNRLWAVQENLERATLYAVAEDYIYKAYRGIFDAS